MYAVDDGIWNGNLDAADIFFLVGTILAVIAAVLYIPREPARSAWAPTALSAALACVAFAFLLL